MEKRTAGFDAGHRGAAHRCVQTVAAHVARRSRAAALVLALALFAAPAGGCTTEESATPTARCRAQTTSQACQTCCTGTTAHDRTNSYQFNAPGDCRCILRYWIFLQ